MAPVLCSPPWLLFGQSIDTVRNPTHQRDGTVNEKRRRDVPRFRWGPPQLKHPSDPPAPPDPPAAPPGPRRSARSHPSCVVSWSFKCVYYAPGRESQDPFGSRPRSQVGFTFDREAYPSHNDTQAESALIGKYRTKRRSRSKLTLPKFLTCIILGNRFTSTALSTLPLTRRLSISSS